ncbi:hypothetical protein ACFLZ0_00430 [Patescibacteria group bacterium]
MKKKVYRRIRIVIDAKVRNCSSKHSKAGAGCKFAKNVPCRSK